MDILSLITLTYSLTLGGYNDVNLAYNSMDTTKHLYQANRGLYTRVESGIKLGFVYVSGYSDIPTVSVGRGLIPARSSYQIEAGIKYKCLKIGYEHICIHNSLVSNYKPDAIFDGGHNRVFIQLKGEINLGGKK